ncbi:putative DNA primase large subunit, eukaryotic/archaeal [Rosa chinensis]|uniref:Putative DNA primase large subunit, eukaryotic/archaeal n=1 Tax=Rosa chinensis TaxID=74649 RepID=A0A2P6QX23_ROSCH|nr:putative DNA primase large subunit, eukaryotic/archaeal [Rosa chinensis]
MTSKLDMHDITGYIRLDRTIAANKQSYLMDFAVSDLLQRPSNISVLYWPLLFWKYLVDYFLKLHMLAHYFSCDSEENLTVALSRMGVNCRALGDVMNVWNKHYQLACTVTFEAVQGTSCEAGINHPNQYFSDSQIIMKSMVH